MRSPSARGSRPLLELAQEVTGKIEPTHRVCNYVATGQMLPDMLDEIHYHVAAPADQEAERIALQTLVEASVCAAFTASVGVVLLVAAVLSFAVSGQGRWCNTSDVTTRC
jgi:hypothetical protein